MRLPAGPVPNGPVSVRLGPGVRQGVPLWRPPGGEVVVSSGLQRIRRWTGRGWLKQAWVPRAGATSNTATATTPAVAASPCLWVVSRTISAICSSVIAALRPRPLLTFPHSTSPLSTNLVRQARTVTAVTPIRQAANTTSGVGIGELAVFLAREAPEVTCVADMRRHHLEAYKLWLATRPRAGGGTLHRHTIRGHLSTLRCFFERISEWGYPAAPPRPLLFAGDLPILDQPLPRFLDDAASTKLLRAVREDADPFTRLVIEVLAHRAAQGRADEPHRRRGRADRLQLLAARPGREAAQRPLHPAAPAAEDPARPVAGRPARGPAHRPDLPGPGTPHPTGPRRPGPGQGRRGRRHRDRHRTPAASPWRPRPSTAACRSRPSRPSSATAPWP